MDTILRIAVQKSGRLSEDSLKLFKKCGIKFSDAGKGRLKTKATNFPVEFLFLRDDDIPGYVEDGVADLGVVGENEMAEQGKNVAVIRKLGFSKCRLSLALPRGTEYRGIEQFDGLRIATSYPNLLGRYLAEKGVSADIHQISGSVEIAPGIGLADGVCDIVSSGSTLLMNGLQEVETIFTSQAVMVGPMQLSAEKQELVDQLVFRMNAVTAAGSNKYILLNAPNERIEEITSLLPGMRSPTILPLQDSGWSSVHSVIQEDDFWDVIDKLRGAGAEGILVVPIEKMIV